MCHVTLNKFTGYAMLRSQYVFLLKEAIGAVKQFACYVVFFALTM